MGVWGLYGAVAPAVAPADAATGADHGCSEGDARRERKGIRCAPRGHTSEPALASPMRVSMLISAERSVVETRRLPKGSRKLLESSSRLGCRGWQAGVHGAAGWGAGGGRLGW